MKKSACLTFDTDVINRLRDLASAQDRFSYVIISLGESGFNVEAKYLLKFMEYAPRLLIEGGLLISLGKQAALAITNNGVGIEDSVKVYAPVDSLFLRHPDLIAPLKENFEDFSYLSTDIVNNSFRQNLLRISAPVLTLAGKAKQAKADQRNALEFCLTGIDGFRTVLSIARVMKQHLNLSENEVLEHLQTLEKERLIFPLTARVDFLAECYRKKNSFRLGRILVASGLISQQQLADLLEAQAELKEQKRHKPLGQLAVETGYLTEQYLDQLLADQRSFGKQIQGPKRTDQEGHRPGESIYGSIGTMDQAMILQTIASTRGSGLLSIESDRGNMTVVFDNGTPIAARLNRVCGKEAMTEMLVFWNDGLFSFHECEVQNAASLTENCYFKSSLDKLLLDSALIGDICQSILSKLPQGINTVLERVWNFEERFQALSNRPLLLADETTLEAEKLPQLANLAGNIDGLSSVEEAIALAPNWSCHRAVLALQALMDAGLLVLSNGQLTQTLEEFQNMHNLVRKELSPQDCMSILELALDLTMEGESEIFNFSLQSGPLLDLRLLRRSGVSISRATELLNLWQSNYLICLRKMNRPLSERLNLGANKNAV